MRRIDPLGNADERLVQRVRAGDTRAFPELVRRHDERLRGLAYKLLAGDRSRMDDAMQNGYLQAFRSIDRFRGDADLGSWLYRIIYNACLDEIRRAKRRPEPVDVERLNWERPSRWAGPERAVVAADEVLRALSALPEDQRVTVVLVDGEGFDHHQAAEILGVAAGTVASRLSRARATMRRLLENEEKEDDQ